MLLITLSAAVLLGTLAECGVLQPKIIGGSATTPGEFPFMVSLQMDYKNGTFKHFCAGAIYDETHIVTAAHCIFDKVNSTDVISVLAGAYDITKQEASQQRVGVSQAFPHPNYTAEGKAGQSDIGVLTLSTPLVFGKSVGSLKLNNKGSTPSGDCVSPGWGNTVGVVSSLIKKGSPTLLKVTSTVISQTECALAYPIFRQQRINTVCAKARLLGLIPQIKGTCQGDSGGPLICKNATDNSQYLGGVVSWGFVGCGVLPDVYGDVGALRDFLDKVLIGGGANGGAGGSTGGAGGSTGGSGSGDSGAGAGGAGAGGAGTGGAGAGDAGTGGAGAGDAGTGGAGAGDAGTGGAGAGDAGTGGAGAGDAGTGGAGAGAGTSGGAVSIGA